MVDLDTLVEAVKREATKAGLVCDPDRAQLLLVVEKVVEKPGPSGNPQASLQVSLLSLEEVANGDEDSYAASLIGSVKPQLDRANR